jgi:hypothetical protein
MLNKISLLNSETGSIAGIILLILTILTLVGLASVYSSNTEVITAGNEVVFKQNLYQAEAAAVENTQSLETEDSDDLLDANNFNWLNNPGVLSDPDNILNPDNWTDVFSQTSIVADTRYLCIYEGIVAGGSLDMSVSQIRAYSIYGRCRQHNGLSVVRLGYRRAF